MFSFSFLGIKFVESKEDFPAKAGSENRISPCSDCYCIWHLQYCQVILTMVLLMMTMTMILLLKFGWAIADFTKSCPWNQGLLFSYDCSSTAFIYQLTMVFFLQGVFFTGFPLKMSENHIEVLRHLHFFQSWGGPVWDSSVFSKSVTYQPTLSKFKGGPVKKNTLYTVY